MKFWVEFWKNWEKRSERSRWPSKYEIHEKILACSHCGSQIFWRRKVLMNTFWSTLFGMDYMDKSATAFVCHSCGQMTFFDLRATSMNPVEE